MLDDDRFYSVAIGLYRYGAVVGIKGDILFIGDKKLLLFIFIVCGRFGISFFRMSEFSYHTSQSGIGAYSDIAP